MPTLAGQSIGRYHLIEQLGEGGMATVYKAYDTRLEREVAFKVIRRGAFPPEQLDQILARFEREAKALAKLSHPYIVKVYDYGEYEGSPYLVMEYLPGGTLKTHLGPDQQVAWAEAMQWLLPVARGLSFAHARGIIHRDVKPANILFSETGELMLTDFGIAKLLEIEAGNTLTASGVGIGTPEYMAPEQGLGQGVDARADIYSLGIVLYEMITGRKPYTADTPMAVVLKQISDPLPRPTQYVPDLPDAVEKVLLKALAKQPEDRYLSMDDFARAMENMSKGIVPSIIPLNVETVLDQQASPQPLVNPTVVDQVPRTPTSQPTQHPTGPDTKKKAPQPGRYIFGGILVLGLCLVAGGLIFRNFFYQQPQAVSTEMPSMTTEPESVDSDGDGFPDSQDACKTQGDLGYGLDPSGCPLPAPDQDKDGVSDDRDTCPTQGDRGQGVDTRGCPMEPAAGEFSQNSIDGAEMVFVPAGEFQMGLTPELINRLLPLCTKCTEKNFQDAMPLHTVELDAYWIYKYEVSNQEYQSCVEQSACSEPVKLYSSTRPDYYTNSKYANYPVIFVDWYRADQYCQWAGGALPTEAQWEKAGRGSEDTRLFPWGNQAPTTSLANYDENLGDTVAGDAYPGGASPYGAMNMAGNVYEWIADWYSADYYSISPTSNPAGPASATLSSPRKVVRGGNWYWTAAYASVAFHDWWEPEKSSWDVGFRCVVPYQP